MHLRSAAIVLLAVSPFAFAQKQELKELQRDVAILQDQLRAVQKSLDENLAAMKALQQTTLDQVNRSNTSLAVLDSGMRDRLKDSVSAPVTNMGSKVDTMTQEFGFVRDSIAELNTRMGKLEQRMVDLNNTVKVVQSPNIAPPGAAAGPSEPPPGTSAESLYRNAMRDKSGGDFALALQEFSQYLQYFGTTEYAPNAQYYIGEVYYNQSKFEEAVKAFDLVLEKYPENNKTLDARYMKGLSLVKLGQRDEGAAEFREIIKRAPGTELAMKSSGQLKNLGLSSGTPPPKKKK